MIKLRRHTTLMHPLLKMMIIQREETTSSESPETNNVLDIFLCGHWGKLAWKGSKLISFPDQILPKHITSDIWNISCFWWGHSQWEEKKIKKYVTFLSFYHSQYSHLYWNPYIHNNNVKGHGFNPKIYVTCMEWVQEPNLCWVAWVMQVLPSFVELSKMQYIPTKPSPQCMHFPFETIVCPHFLIYASGWKNILCPQLLSWARYNIHEQIPVVPSQLRYPSIIIQPLCNTYWARYSFSLLR